MVENPTGQNAVIRRSKMRKLISIETSWMQTAPAGVHWLPFSKLAVHPHFQDELLKNYITKKRLKNSVSFALEFQRDIYLQEFLTQQSRSMTKNWDTYRFLSLSFFRTGIHSCYSISRKLLLPRFGQFGKARFWFLKSHIIPWMRRDQ